MKRVFLLAFGYALMISCNSKEPAEQQAATPAAAETKPQPAELADAKYIDIGKAQLAAMQSGDVDKWLNSFADNARYFWNSGDSLVGKTAISDYWKKRRTEVIDSISFMNDIWLPVKVNEPQQQVQTPGVWLLGWYQINAKYKTGKSMQQWSHVDFHFDANDKIDQVVQYVDKVPINAAMVK